MSGTQSAHASVATEKELLVGRDAARSGATSDAFLEGNLSSDRLRRATFAAC